MVQFMMLLLSGCTKLSHQLWIKQVQNGSVNDSILEDFHLEIKGIYIKIRELLRRMEKGVWQFTFLLNLNINFFLFDN